MEKDIIFATEDLTFLEVAIKLELPVRKSVISFQKANDYLLSQIGDALEHYRVLKCHPIT
jgi:hypothetical protein